MAEFRTRALTIGHSNHSIEVLLGLLTTHQVEIVVDTRSYPYSKYSPQFDQPALKDTLRTRDIRYLYLGKELGGRPDRAEFYDSEGHVLYDRVACSPFFQKGMARLEKGLGTFRVALLCSEENPTGCHRRLLIGHVLAEHGVAVEHIRGNGRLQSEADLLREESADDAQFSLFEHTAAPQWKSILSVLPKKRLNSSSLG
jgi:uncharacterized protein (DUF488 family)